jgi:hypothetical protein
MGMSAHMARKKAAGDQMTLILVVARDCNPGL